jgi:hypothetical protein
MRRSAFSLPTVFLAFFVGVASHMIWESLYVPSWQYADTLCGISDIENPLCAHSPSLHEIPDVEFCSLVHNPETYNRKIIRIRGTFINGGASLFGAHLEHQACNGEQSRITANYWNDDTISNISYYLDAFASMSNSARVTVVGEFIDPAGHGHKTSGGNRFHFIILRTEKIFMAPAPPKERLYGTH